jgi:hypothetical protein
MTRNGFLHWYNDSRWLDEKGAVVGERNHPDAVEVAHAILEILKKYRFLIGRRPAT